MGEHPLQLYSLATPNGVKVCPSCWRNYWHWVSREAEYDSPWLVNIMEGDQFSSGFVRSPAPTRRSGTGGPQHRHTDPGIRVGAILLYLAEKHGQFLPADARAECLSWVFWQMGSAFLGGGFGHFYAYAPERLEYPINRFTMEVKRQLDDVLDRNLAEREFICGDPSTIADMAIHPWYGALAMGMLQ